MLTTGQAVHTSKLLSQMARSFSTAKPQKQWVSYYKPSLQIIFLQKDKKILIAGCRGQIGTALTAALIAELGADKIVAADLVESDPKIECAYEQLDVTDYNKYEKIVKEHKIDYILHLAAILSALGEKHPELAYDVNVTGATHAMNISRDNGCQLFVPSSIAAFGGDVF